MRFINPNENPNAIFGILLLVLLAIFAGPNTLPQLINDVAPFIDEGVPCSRLRNGEDRAFHQSLIGRSASQAEDPPISLSISVSPLPTTQDDSFIVTIIVYNDTLGTVPILVPDELETDQQDIPTTNGLGVIAGANSVSPVTPVDPAAAGAYPAEVVRLLGPRQRCVYRTSYQGTQVPSQFGVPGNTVRAYYRNSTAGGIVISPNENRIPVYNDQGLWVGVAVSEPATIPAPAQ